MNQTKINSKLKLIGDSICLKSNGMPFKIQSYLWKKGIRGGYIDRENDNLNYSYLEIILKYSNENKKIISHNSKNIINNIKWLMGCYLRYKTMENNKFN